MTPLANWEAKWVSPVLAGASVLKGLPILPGYFSGSNQHEVVTGTGTLISTPLLPACVLGTHPTKAPGNLGGGRTLSGLKRPTG